jgi:hypothetical protein
MITTFEEACEFILENRVVTLFASGKSSYPSLWDHVGLSEEKPAGGGWSEKISAIWTWKNEIPATFPDEIFYGKVPGGDAVLMEMEYLRTIHYPGTHQPVSELGPLGGKIYDYIEAEPRFTGDLRRVAMQELGCTRSRFETALKKLQISLNIVRSNDPAVERDLWLPFRELYPDIVRLHSGQIGP